MKKPLVGPGVMFTSVAVLSSSPQLANSQSLAFQSSTSGSSPSHKATNSS